MENLSISIISARGLSHNTNTAQGEERSKLAAVTSRGDSAARRRAGEVLVHSTSVPLHALQRRQIAGKATFALLRVRQVGDSAHDGERAFSQLRNRLRNHARIVA